MKICISAESTIDTSKELLNRFDIHTVPFTVLVGDETHLDGEIDNEILFSYFDEKGVLPKTSAVNEFQYVEHFEKLLKEYDAIIHFTLSSEMSSAYQNACNAAKEMKNVYIVDSRTLSTGIALLAMAARDMAEQGLDPETIVNNCKALTDKVQASFVINTMDYLYKGGRCSAVQKFGATILRLKPEIVVKEGKMAPASNYRGKNSAVISDYCVEVLSKNMNPDLTRAFVTYSSASEDMINVAKEKLAAAGFKEIFETQAGATVSSHCGPKTLGILFINK